jgi:hypothetical protein
MKKNSPWDEKFDLIALTRVRKVKCLNHSPKAEALAAIPEVPENVV